MEWWSYEGIFLAKVGLDGLTKGVFCAIFRRQSELKRNEIPWREVMKRTEIIVFSILVAITAALIAYNLQKPDENCQGEAVCASEKEICVSSKLFMQGKVYQKADAYFVGYGSFDWTLKEENRVSPNNFGYFCKEVSEKNKKDTDFSLVSILTNDGISHSQDTESHEWIWLQTYGHCSQSPQPEECAKTGSFTYLLSAASKI